MKQHLTVPVHSPTFAQTFMLTGDNCTCHRIIGSCSCIADFLPEQEIVVPAPNYTKPKGRP